MIDDLAKVEAFLEGLQKLANDHGIAIEGCGCCDSPYLSRSITCGIPASFGPTATAATFGC